jgi:site-specific DNA recombinase
MSSLRAVPATSLRAVLYLRQSTFREESISLELQETAGRDYCDRHGYTVIAVEADPGISGRTWKRPAVQRVMDMVEGGNADVIVLWRWSRLSRSRKDWAVAADRIDVAGGRIESATEPNDVTAAGRFARGVMTELSAFESERIGEQWKEVHERRRQRGLPGGGKVPYGWKYVDGIVIPDPINGPAIRRMYDLYLAGHGARHIARWLEDHGYRTYSGKTTWSYSSVTQTLDSAFHAGYVIHGDELRPGAHTGLISEELWQRYMATRRERAATRAVKNRYLLSGIARCASCGNPMYGFTIAAKHGHRTDKDYFGYRCNQVSDHPEHGPGTMSARVVDAVVLKWLRELAHEPDWAETPATPTDAKLDAQRIAREITSIDKQVITLSEGLASGLVPERAYRSTVTALEERRSKLSETLQAAEDRIVLSPAAPQSDARDLLEKWEWIPLEMKRQSLRSLLLSIDVTCGTHRIVTIVPRWGSPVVITV